MPTVLITGANRGLGLEFVKQYADAGWLVHACCRDPAKAKALAKLTGAATILHELDVANARHVLGLARTLRSEAIDVLINNAGVYGGEAQTFGKLDGTSWDETLRINALGPLLVSQALVDHVARGGRKIIACVTSKMGSMADNTSGGAYVYRASKAALNAVGVSLARDLAAKGITVLLFHPGWVQTDMGGKSAPVKPKDSIAGMRRVIDAATAKDSGRFLNYDGGALSW
ncbi:MAG: SDR family oxidoreductase [Alphaproteobacteria bacterium]|nr:SDR family oxidoreductase [Alphaproteobacteria bacterium]